jgi:hypothetical protein
MAVHLDDIFPCIGPGGSHDDSHDFVDKRPFATVNPTVIKMMGSQRSGPLGRVKKAGECFFSRRSGNADNSNAAFS